MKPYNTPERLGTDQGGSVDRPIVYMQRLEVVSGLNANHLLIPCDLDTVEQCFITPVAKTTSDNQNALFIDGTGWEIEALDNASLKALSDIPDWNNSIVYKVGSIVDGNEDNSEAHVCVVAHSSDSTFAPDEVLGYWETIPSEKFIKVNFTAPGTGTEIVNVHVLLLGKMST